MTIQKVHHVLDEIIVGGLVMETNVTEIYGAVQLANSQETRVLPGSKATNKIFRQ